MASGEADTGMSIRLSRFLPRYPGVLLMPAVLGLWIGLCTVGREDPRGMATLMDSGFALEWREVYGVPFYFVGSKRVPGRGPNAWRGYGFRVVPFLIDIALALATAYIVAVGVERLVLFKIQARHRRRLGQGEPN